MGWPVWLILTAGQRGDASKAGPLIEGLPADAIMVDAAYDASHLREAIAKRSAVARSSPTIPRGGRPIGAATCGAAALAPSSRPQPHLHRRGAAALGNGPAGLPSITASGGPG